MALLELRFALVSCPQIQSRHLNFEFIALQVKNTLDCTSFGTDDQEFYANIEMTILRDKAPTIGSNLH